MPQLSSISLNFDDGSFSIITVGPNQTTVKTPFGPVDLTNSQPKAPTGVDIADNPNAYEGTTYDPLNYRPPLMWNGEVTGIYLTWADWYTADSVQALDYISNKGVLGKPLNLNKLSPKQKFRLKLG